MNREIIFKGKSNILNKWVYGDLITSPNGIVKYIIEKTHDPVHSYHMINNTCEVSPETVGIVKCTFCNPGIGEGKNMNLVSDCCNASIICRACGGHCEPTDLEEEG